MVTLELEVTMLKLSLLDQAGGNGFYVPYSHFCPLPEYSGGSAYFCIDADTCSVLTHLPDDPRNFPIFLDAIVNELLMQNCQASLNTVFPELCHAQVRCRPTSGLIPGARILITHKRWRGNGRHVTFTAKQEPVEKTSLFIGARLAA